MRLDNPTRHRRRRAPNKLQLFHGSKSLLAALEREFPVSGHQINFSANQKTIFLHGLFTALDLTALLEGKVCCGVNAVFPFVAELLNRSIGCWTNPVLTHILKIYSNIFNSIVNDPCALTAHKADVSSALPKMKDLKRKAKTCLNVLKL